MRTNSKFQWTKVMKVLIFILSLHMSIIYFVSNLFSATITKKPRMLFCDTNFVCLQQSCSQKHYWKRSKYKPSNATMKEKMLYTFLFVAELTFTVSDTNFHLPTDTGIFLFWQSHLQYLIGLFRLCFQEKSNDKMEDTFFGPFSYILAS